MTQIETPLDLFRLSFWKPKLYRYLLTPLNYTIRNFNGKPDFVWCVLVQNGLWPVDIVQCTWLHCSLVTGIKWSKLLRSQVEKLGGQNRF